MTVTGSNSRGRVGRDRERHCDPILCLSTQSRNRRRPSCPCGNNTIWMLIACVNVGPILSVLAALCAITMPASRMVKTKIAQIRKGFDTKILWHPEDTHTQTTEARRSHFGILSQALPELSIVPLNLWFCEYSQVSVNRVINITSSWSERHWRMKGKFSSLKTLRSSLSALRKVHLWIQTDALHSNQTVAALKTLNVAPLVKELVEIQATTEPHQPQTEMHKLLMCGELFPWSAELIHLAGTAISALHETLTVLGTLCSGAGYRVWCSE